MNERPLTRVRPLAPAAVRIYGADGCCVALCLDLDASRGGVAAVRADEQRLTAWLRARGARVLSDRSPSGGAHIYVPLAERTPFEVAREVVEALAASHPTLDPSPHRSLKTGCIRPPGAAHASGGSQVLTVQLAAAHDVLRRPNSPAVLDAIRAELSEEIAAWRASSVAAGLAAGKEGLDRAPVARGALGARVRAIAETGVYDQARYRSPSEARQAVIAGAARAGWTLTDVAVRVADGRWPGLAAMYARYSPARRHTSLAQDWHAAATYVAAQRETTSDHQPSSHAHRSHTSHSETQGGHTDQPPVAAEHDHIRTWRTLLRATELHRLPGRRNHLARFVLRALGEAAHKSGDRRVAFGTRSLAVATGTEYSSVAAVLRRLSEQPGGWIDLIEPARGEHADLYELTIPTDLTDMARDLGWDRGHAHALRPAFRELGHVAAFVFEAVEAGRAATTATLVTSTGLSRNAVAGAVDALAAHRLLERSPAGLTAHPERLIVVAEMLGTLDVVTAQLRRYARDREVWRAYLTRHDPNSVESPQDAAEDYWWPPDDAADEAWTLTSVLRRAA